MEKSHVSIAQAVCPVCGKVEDTGDLLLNRTLRKTLERKTTVGYDLCSECQPLSEHHIALIEIIPDENTPVKMKVHEPNRTGKCIWIKKEAFEKTFNCPPNVPIVFIDQEVSQFLEGL